jgi:hypothetical protein
MRTGSCRDLRVFAILAWTFVSSSLNHFSAFFFLAFSLPEYEIGGVLSVVFRRVSHDPDIEDRVVIFRGHVL